MNFCFYRDIELFALFVSCLCHDIDHRGTNNSYQVASVSFNPQLKWEGIAVKILRVLVPYYCHDLDHRGTNNSY